jgi:hypothetical protein
MKHARLYLLLFVLLVAASPVRGQDVRPPPQVPPPPRRQDVPPPPQGYIAEVIRLSRGGEFAYPRDSVIAQWVGSEGFLVRVEKLVVKVDTVHQNSGYGATVEQAANQCLQQETEATQDTTRASDGSIQMACGIATRWRIQRCERTGGTWLSLDKGYACERRNTFFGVYAFDYRRDEGKWRNGFFASGWTGWR